MLWLLREGFKTFAPEAERVVAVSYHYYAKTLHGGGYTYEDAVVWAEHYPGSRWEEMVKIETHRAYMGMWGKPTPPWVWIDSYQFAIWRNDFYSVRAVEYILWLPGGEKVSVPADEAHKAFEKFPASWELDGRHILMRFYPELPQSA